MFGVKDSKLITELYSKRNTSLPVGQVALTSDPTKLNKQLQESLAQSGEWVDLRLEVFDAVDREGLEVSRNTETSGIDFLESEAENPLLLKDASFDGTKGELIFIRSNGQKFVISGFLTLSDFGTGPEGPRGLPGNDGKDAHDGDDGDDGDDGCPGEQGPKGDIGPEGIDGDDGKRGPPGDIGKIGEQGEQGEVGPIGRQGDDGARGMPGLSCSAEGEDGESSLTGPQGAAGVSPIFSVVIAADYPENNVMVWGIPE